MIVVGLTGSIGMGKSTTAQMFRASGIPVHDADAAVHELYAGKAAPLIEAAFPGTTDQTGVNRQALRSAVLGDPEAMKKLEAIVHPLVRDGRDAFLDNARTAGAPLAVLDVPLLFETGGDQLVDAIVVVSAPESVQRERVLARPGMDEDALAAILSRQTPDHEKRARADFIIDTSNGLDAARNAVIEIIATLSSGHWERSSRD